MVQPDKLTAARALSEWVRSYDVSIPLPEFTPLSVDSKKRRRLRLKIDKRLDGLLYDEAQLIAWSLALKLMPPSVVDKWLGYLRISHYGDRDRLKLLSGIYKKYNYLIDDNWYYYVDGNLIGDYFPSQSSDDIIKAVEHWIKGDMEHKFSDGISFYEVFSAGVWGFLRNNLKTPSRPYVSVNQFLADPMYWATPGSSDAKRLFVTTPDGVRLKTRRSKWASAIAMSQAELRILYYSTAPQRNKAVTKRELGKARMIIAGDMSNYLRMAWISYWLEDVMRANNHMSMLYNKDKAFTMWQEMLENTAPDRIRKYYNMPTDESEYDHHITSEMLLRMLNAIEKMIQIYYEGPDMSDMLLSIALIRGSLINNGVVTVRKEDGTVVEIPVQRGLLSGWRWTAFLNTLANGGKLNGFRYVIMLRSNVWVDPVKDFSTLGDDIRSRLDNLTNCAALLDIYKETNFDVNPGKFFISKDCDEYLRKIALLGKRLTGYPLRGVSALCFSNPVSELPYPGKNRVSEMFESWMTVVRRMQSNESQYYRLMIHDIAQANGLSNMEVDDIIHAAACNGGMGMHPLNDKLVNYTESSVQYLARIPESESARRLGLNENQVKFLDRQYALGVQMTGKVERKITRFSVSITTARNKMSLLYAAPPLMPIYSDYTFRLRNDLPPSTAMAIKDEMLTLKRCQLHDYMQKFADEVTLARYTSIVNRTSIGVIRDWIGDKLVPSPPSHPLQGQLITSVVMKKYYNTYLADMFARGRVSVTRLATIQEKCELMTYDYLNSLDYVMQE